MTGVEVGSLEHLQLSIQRALLNEVTPDLRGVAVEVSADKVSARFIYESALSDAIRERVEDIETEVVADYSGLTPVEVIPESLPVTSQRQLHEGEHWAYLRHEAPIQ